MNQNIRMEFLPYYVNLQSTSFVMPSRLIQPVTNLYSNHGKKKKNTSKFIDWGFQFKSEMV